MVEELTPQQHQAVINRGGKLLVSAAAGSGKTKVLVDRLMGYLEDPIAPANLDDFLIITYTKAAASELRGKIGEKLSQRLAQQPENRHLYRQTQRLYLTKISTVHAFCGDLLREYAYQLDLSGDFRVADENECRQIRTQLVEQVLDAAYAGIGDDPSLQAFVDTQGLGRNDGLLKDIILKVYDSARCHKDPQDWLDKCRRNARIGEITDAAKTTWGEFLMQDLFLCLDREIQAMERCTAMVEAMDGAEKQAKLMGDTVQQLRYLRQAKTWDEVVARRDIDYGRLTFGKKIDDPQVTGPVKAIRDACKETLKKKLEAFTDDSAQALADLSQCAQAVDGMLDLVQRFWEEYDRVKKNRRILDFADLEHKTLDLLLGKSRSGITAAAREIGQRFREIMVDEYQDSNAVQDAIFTALTQERQNCFMVGDVKQSIYQFRLADPEIFLKKYNAYAPWEQAQPGQGRKILLSANFRSGGEVLHAVNEVFETCMSPEVGGLTYGLEEALSEGIPHCSLGETAVELHAIEVDKDSYAQEANFVAQQIQTLLDGSHMVRAKEGLRPITPDDVVILLRSPNSSAGYFVNALESRGIRVISGGDVDLLQTPEVSVLRSLLEIIDNPRQDIPLLGVLSSPVFGFTADDLARIRGNCGKVCFYQALAADTSEKTLAFRNTLGQLRAFARMHTLSNLLEEIFRLTRLDSIYAAMDGGEICLANLHSFYQLAVEFQGTARRDLSQFLEHLTLMAEKGLSISREKTQGCVTIMSIHKSKGLEFPVVFLSGLSRRFNREDLNAQVLYDRELGLGLSCVDDKNRVRYPSIAKRAIGVKTIRDSLSEELRVLYVAMTRAKDRLIMTYADSGLAKWLTQLALRMDDTPRELLTGTVGCPGAWVFLEALRHTEAGELFALGDRPRQTRLGNPPWKIQVHGAQLPLHRERREKDDAPQMPDEAVGRIRRGLAFHYSHIPATQTPSKQTATQRKGREKDEEVLENTRIQSREHTWRRPGTPIAKGKEVGNAMHLAMQYLPFAKCQGAEQIRQEVEKLVDSHFLTPQQAALVDAQKIAAFFQTELGEKIARGQTLREFKFSLLDDASRYGQGLEGEEVLLQGVVDCALMEPDGMTVVDFKTDYVTEETLDALVARYTPQVQTYANALERIYRQPVKASYLYFFHLNRFVPV